MAGNPLPHGRLRAERRRRGPMGAGNLCLEGTSSCRALCPERAGEVLEAFTC